MSEDDFGLGEYDGPDAGSKRGEKTAAATERSSQKQKFGIALPKTAIVWNNKERRARQLTMWTRAFMSAFGTQARALKLGWIIKDLAAGKGCCFAGNEYLAEQTGIPVKRVDETLTLLERSGAIIRTRVATRKGRVRRIYLSVDIIAGNPPKTGGMQTAQQSPRNGGSGYPPETEGMRNPPKPGENDPPESGGVEIIEELPRTSLAKNEARAGASECARASQPRGARSQTRDPRS